jgi:hypothetical protein
MLGVRHLRGRHRRERSSGPAAWRWGRRHALSLALAATAVSIAVGLSVDPLGPLLRRLAAAARWVVPTEVVLDLLIGLGAALMLAAATGSFVQNPLKAKTYLRQLPACASTSWTFKAGFALATAASLAWGFVAVAAVLAYLPLPAWGALAFPAVDLALTVALRHAIWTGIRHPPSVQVTVVRPGSRR